MYILNIIGIYTYVLIYTQQLKNVLKIYSLVKMLIKCVIMISLNIFKYDIKPKYITIFSLKINILFNSLSID